jgi:hypothetical protein
VWLHDDRLSRFESGRRLSRGAMAPPAPTSPGEGDSTAGPALARRASELWVTAFQRRTVPSLVAATTVFASALNARAVTSPDWRGRSPSRLRVTESHSWTFPSSPADASVVPLGLSATAFSAPSGRPEAAAACAWRCPTGVACRRHRRRPDSRPVEIFRVTHPPRVERLHEIAEQVLQVA